LGGIVDDVSLPINVKQDEVPISSYENIDNMIETIQQKKIEENIMFDINYFKKNTKTYYSATGNYFCKIKLYKNTKFIIPHSSEVIDIQNVYIEIELTYTEIDSIILFADWALKSFKNIVSIRENDCDMMKIL
jgi:hypothetical protein